MSTDRWHRLAAAYALDALEGEERSGFEEQMAADPELQRLVEEYRGAAGSLAEALPRVEPPAALRERLLARVRAGAGEGDRAPAPRRGRAPGRPLLTGLALAASIAGLAWLGVEYTDLRSEAQALAGQLDQIRESLATAEAELASFDSLALLLSGPELRFASLTGEDLPPALRLVWSPERQLLLIAANNLPAPPQGRTYQLWGLRGNDAPVSLGVFETGPAGTALVTRPLASAADFELSAVTEEPDGGSPAPTTTPFLVGSWSAAQD